MGDRRSLDVPRTRPASPRGRPALTDRHAEQSRCFLDAAPPKHHDDRLRVRVRLGWSVRRRRELAGDHQRGLDQTCVDPSPARCAAAARRTIRGPTGRPWSLPEPEPSGFSPAVRANSNSSSRSSPRRIASSPRSPMSKLAPSSFLAVGAGSVSLAGASVSQIDPPTDKVVRTIPVGGSTRTPCGIAATQDAVWVAIGDSFCAPCDTIGARVSSLLKPSSGLEPETPSLPWRCSTN